MDKVLSNLRRIAQTYPTRGTQDAVIAAVEEIQRLRADLAAARAQNQECNLLLSRVLHDAIKELRAALAGEKK